METYYSVDADDLIHFTEDGIRVLGPLLARAGVNIRNIKTRTEYLDAQNKAKAYMGPYLESMAKGDGSDKNTLDRKLLIAAVIGDEDEVKRLKAKKLARKRLTLIK
jgi:hypothetical protein